MGTCPSWKYIITRKKIVFVELLRKYFFKKNEITVFIFRLPNLRLFKYNTKIKYFYGSCVYIYLFKRVFWNSVLVCNPYLWAPMSAVVQITSPPNIPTSDPIRSFFKSVNQTVRIIILYCCASENIRLMKTHLYNVHTLLDCNLFHDDFYTVLLLVHGRYVYTLI